MTPRPRRLSVRVLTFVLPLALVATAAFKAGAYVQGQPHMEAAIAAMNTAMDHLKQATEDKGGHKAKAMMHLKEAIAQTQAGIDYAKANH